MFELLRQSIHYSLHIILPGIISYYFFHDKWKKAWIIMLFTMTIDLDHLISSPIFDPNRCSFNYHILHTYYAALAYTLLFSFRKTRIIGLAAILHLLTDIEDCFWI